MLVFALIAAMLSAYIPFNTINAYAATNTVTLVRDHQVTYGTGDGAYTNAMNVVGLKGGLGTRNVYCTQPALPTPPAGVQTVDKTYDDSAVGTGAVMRTLVYYSPTYPGWKDVKTKYFSGFTEDEAYA